MTLPPDKNLPSAVREAIRVQMVNFGEIPDRTSPDDFPEGYVLTREEIVDAFVRIIEVDRAERSSIEELEYARVLLTCARADWYRPPYSQLKQDIDKFLDTPRDRGRVEPQQPAKSCSEGVEAGSAVSAIVPTTFPKQGEWLGRRVVVCFNYDTSKQFQGVIVRDDAEQPGRCIIGLDDGRYVLTTECQWRTQS